MRIRIRGIVRYENLRMRLKLYTLNDQDNRKKIKVDSQTMRNGGDIELKSNPSGSDFFLI